MPFISGVSRVVSPIPQAWLHLRTTTTSFNFIRGMHSSKSRGDGGRGGRGGPRGGKPVASGHVPSASFGKTLQFITSIKLEELEKQRVAFEAHSAVIEKAAAFADDLPRRVQLLLETVRSWRGSGAVSEDTVIGGKLDLSSIDLWLLQARKDPGFSPDVVRDWADTLEAHIRHSMTRFEFAKLFGGLFNEWLSSGDSVTSHDSAPRTPPSDEFIEPKTIDTDNLFAYLADLFSEDSSLGVLDRMRRGMEQFGEDLQSRVISADDMRWVIKSLLASNLMLEEKRNTLREFTQNPTVLDELATVMTMRLSSVDAWTWPHHGVQVDMRRHLNGKYRAFTDPDLFDALFLQYIGVMWQVKFKQAAQDIFSSKAWKQEFLPFSRAQPQDRQNYHFLVGQLSTQVDSSPSYDDWENPDKTQLPASHVKQELLHTVSTEAYLNTTLHKTHTVVCTDLEWFGPSLAFDTISTCLKFFGVSQKWLDFFKTFLQVPLAFKDDKPGDAPRVRQCGTPISYALSTFFGEVVLFGLDFAYAAFTGLTLNESKTGSVCVGADIAPELPSGEIRWGFLKFESSQSRFVIDQAEVDKHIVELRRQLAATKSVFGWINAYNKYMAFFSRNFGARPTVTFGPALCLGQADVDNMIDTLARIQSELFPASPGAVGHLRTVIEERFGVHDLPDGYFYFPIASGGMELQNPLIELLAVRDEFGSDPASKFSKQIEKDAEAYRALQEKWNSKGSTITRQYDTFPPFEDYIACRETGLAQWKSRYCELMSTTNPRHLEVPIALEEQSTSPLRMNFYNRWVLSLYGDQLVKKFGSLDVVDPNLIPVGLVHLFRGSRHQWDQ
ncbi:hypothetical protein C8R44DRAFT_876040 [Mycena epipterygia]|nr:hypothetical protein C8R44DRAFT_876040 [Mycena epipterygia]